MTDFRFPITHLSSRLAKLLGSRWLAVLGLSLLSGLVGSLGAVRAGAQEAQDPTQQAPPIENEETAEADSAIPPGADPSGSARLLFDGNQVASVGFSLRADGPRFALAPIAKVLDVELRIGPLGDAHTLVFEDRHIILGPDDPAMVTITRDGSSEETLSRLQHHAIKTGRGLEVPLSFLDRTFGERLGYEFEWSFRNLELVLRRRQLRLLSGSINLVHQHRASTVEIAFSERPRYRFEELPGAVEVHLVGYSLALDEAFSRPADPLVSQVIASPTKIRIELASDAKAFEPRLIDRGGRISMVIDVLRQRNQAPTLEPPPFLSTEESRSSGLRTIVLDPGHGGAETGALGSGGTVESELTLTMARMLRTRLERRLPVQVVLTRDSNVDVPHETRVAIANENKADLFISLHFNSYPGSRARGAETYFLSREASDQVAARSAEVENRSASRATPRGDDLELILWDLAQSYHLGESQRFANLVQEELNRALDLRDRGVRQAPFRVLMGADMPAVLVELGFISNPEEEARLQSPAYLADLADALVRAIKRLETQLGARQQSAATPAPPAEGRGSGPAGGGR